MVIVRHTAESCPGRPGNEAIVPCLQKLPETLAAAGVTTIGRWADPPGHVNFLVLDAPHAHAIVDALMESGLGAYTTSEIRPVLSMDG